MGTKFRTLLAPIGVSTGDGRRFADGGITLDALPLPFEGHGWCIANSIIIRNCRCTLLLVERGESTDLSNRQFKGR